MREFNLKDDVLCFFPQGIKKGGTVTGYRKNDDGSYSYRVWLLYMAKKSVTIWVRDKVVEKC